MSSSSRTIFNLYNTIMGNPKILIVVKRTGANFIEHLISAIPAPYAVAGSHRGTLDMIRIEEPEVVLFEWANDLTAIVTRDRHFVRLKKTQGFKVVVRIHDHEVTKPAFRAQFVNYDVVDRIWFINPAVRQYFHDRLSFDRNSTYFLPNAVDADKFNLSIKRYKRVGFLSIFCRPRKGFLRALHLANVCRDWDFYFRFHIPGEGEAYYDHYKQLREYVDHNELGNVIFEHRDANMLVLNHYRGDKLQEWYADKAVILSTSEHEGFHYAVAQGMLTGCMPIVYPWNTARVFWGDYVVDRLDGAKQALDNYENGHEQEYRRFVKESYDPVNIYREFLVNLGL